MEYINKFVEFDKYCDMCEYKDCNEGDEPCNSCLSEPVNEYSCKPVCFKDKEANKEIVEKRKRNE